MYNRMSDFMVKHNLLHDNQFGFRKNRSTYMAINVLVDKYHEALEKNEYMIGLFLDLSRAFDTISHDLLLRKLQRYGMRGIAHNWLMSYLKNRKQYVNYQNENSKTVLTNIGVPQGSILGPLLFILYVNDFSNISNKLSFIQFADDTSIFASGPSLSEIGKNIEAEMKCICEWLQNNRLTLNVTKTNYMVMCAKNKTIDTSLSIKINNMEIECVHETKFLGVIIDDKCLYKSHINYIANKISKFVGILHRAKGILDIQSLKVLYFTLVQPYFTYCLTIWGHTYESYLSRLYALQKKIIRIISREKYDAHTKPLFKSHKIMRINELYNYFISTLVYRSRRGEIPFPFKDYFKNNIGSRIAINLKPAKYKRKACEFSIKSMGPKIWNSLSSDVKNSSSLRNMKKKMKAILF